ncbi:MAG: hypothetical protein JXA71_08975 [Chitinispirillaceae bacterium]|nr:hypothetical protein [Chitinispirillaceae bacterium]
MRGFLTCLSAAVVVATGALRAVDAAVLFSSVSTRELSVGDRVHFSVSIIGSKGATIVPPDPASSFGTLAVKEWNSRKFQQDKVDSTVFDYALTTYKPEPCTIPALSWLLENGDARDTLKSESIPLTVVPLITSDSADIMDLRPQQVTGKRPLLWLWLLLGALSVLASTIIIRYYTGKMRRPPPPPPPKPPYDEAIESLAALDAKQYLLKGLVREYVFELSEILKRYIERRFNVNAAEFTTEEMLCWLGISPLEKSQRNAMEWFFRATDPVKFAKHLPDQETIGRFGPEARSFIEATRPLSEPAAQSGDRVVPQERKESGGGGA